MTDAELNKATVFDFTSDAALLEDITGCVPEIESDKAFYIQHATPFAKAVDMISYAERTDNKELTTQLEAVFGDFVAACFNE